MHKWHFEESNKELLKQICQHSQKFVNSTFVQCAHVHCPWPSSQDAVIKCIYASPGLQCNKES